MVSAGRVATGLIGVMVVALVAFLLFVGARVERRKDAATPRSFPAAPYRWTRTCPPSDMSGAPIPRACIRKEYRLGSVWTMGLDGGRGHDWYRIGNHAVDVDCPVLSRSAPCAVRRIVHDKFLQEQRTG